MSLSTVRNTATGERNLPAEASSSRFARSEKTNLGEAKNKKEQAKKNKNRSRKATKKATNKKKTAKRAKKTRKIKSYCVSKHILIFLYHSCFFVSMYVHRFSTSFKCHNLHI